MVTVKDLGAVTAYAYAVQLGYTGTEEEFAEVLARQATVAAEAAGYADAAKESADASAASAEEAKTQAESAAGSAAATAQGVSAAASYASNANTSANSASGFATAASNYSAAAKESSDNAAESETAAAGSASAAATSASAAATSATAASDKADAAAASATAAATSESNAAASAARVADAVETVEALDAKVNRYDDLAEIIKISDTATTLGDINALLNASPNGVNIRGDHVFFDMSALGVMMYLCTIFIDTDNGVYKVFDLVSGRYAEGTYNASMLLTMATAQANGLAVQSQIDKLQAEIDELGGKHVVANWDVFGGKIADGTSEEIVKPGDMANVNWIASVLGTTTRGLTVACSDIWAFAKAVGEAEAKDYLFVYNGSAWTYNEEVVDLADYALTVTGTPSTGEVMDVKTTVNSRSFTFVSYDTVEAADETVEHNWCVEQTYAPDAKAYCTYQALFAVYKGKRIPVGYYHLRNYCYRSSFSVDMYLNVTEEIGSDEYIVQARSNGYTNGQTITNADGVSKTGVAVISGLTPQIYGTRTKASGAVSIAYTPESGVSYTELTDLNTNENDPVVFVSNGVFDKCVYGNNCWENSNMSEWLNDDPSAKTEIEPIWMLYVPAAYNLTAGYLYGIDPRAYALIQEAKVKWVSGYGNDDYTQGQTYETEQKVFLLSMKEMSFNLQTTEGEVTQLYSEYTDGVLTNDPVIDRAKYNRAGGTINTYRWSRSGYSSDARFARLVTATGTSGNYSAYYAYYYAPAFILGKSTNQ